MSDQEKASSPSSPRPIMVSFSSSSSTTTAVTSHTMREPAIDARTTPLLEVEARFIDNATLARMRKLAAISTPTKAAQKGKARLVAVISTDNNTCRRSAAVPSDTCRCSAAAQIHTQTRSITIDSHCKSPPGPLVAAVPRDRQAIRGDHTRLASNFTNDHRATHAVRPGSTRKMSRRLNDQVRVSVFKAVHSAIPRIGP